MCVWGGDLQLEEVLLHRGLHRLEPARHLLVVLVELPLDLAPLALDVLPVREQLVHAVPLARVRALELPALLEHILHVPVDPVAVEHQVVVGELALRRQGEWALELGVGLGLGPGLGVGLGLRLGLGWGSSACRATCRLRISLESFS